MMIGKVYKATSKIRYEIIKWNEESALFTAKQLDGAGTGREVIFNKSKLNSMKEVK